MKPAEIEEIDDVVCDLMRKFGPDRHVDGHEKITEYIVSLLITEALMSPADFEEIGARVIGTRVGGAESGRMLLNRVVPTPTVGEVISAAVAAERERCAQIADKWAEHMKTIQETPAVGAAEYIAQEIREPLTGEGATSGPSTASKP